MSKLEVLKKEHKEFDKSYRATLYRFLQQAAAFGHLLEADDDMKSRFRTKLKEKDVLRGVLIFIFDAKSESEKKEASKRALALKYLIQNSVWPVVRIAN